LKSLSSLNHFWEPKSKHNDQMPFTPFTMKTRGMIITERIRAKIITELPADWFITPGDRHDKMKKKLNNNTYYTKYQLGEMLAAYTFYTDYKAAIGHAPPFKGMMTHNELKGYGMRQINKYAIWAKDGRI